MTPKDRAKAQSIIWRLFKKALHIKENERMMELVDRIGKEYRAGNYKAFLAAAKELNGMYKRLTEPEDTTHWEH